MWWSYSTKPWLETALVLCLWMENMWQLVEWVDLNSVVHVNVSNLVNLQILIQEMFVITTTKEQCWAVIISLQLKYIQAAAVSPDSTAITSAPYISAYIGTPPNPSYRRCSRLLWRLGPTHLIEEPLSGATAEQMYRLGPNYVGSFQAPCPEGQLKVVSVIGGDLAIKTWLSIT